MKSKNPFKPVKKGQQFAVLAFGVAIIIFSLYSSKDEKDKKVFNYLLEIKDIFTQSDNQITPGIIQNIQNKCLVAIKNNEIMKVSEHELCKHLLLKVNNKKPLSK